MRKRKNRGGATIEFALTFPFLVSLIVGTLVYGSQLVKELELQQVARDTASMTARGTNFNNAANQAVVSRLGVDLGWPSSGGLLSTSPGVVYVSTIEYLDATCNGLAGGCKNAPNWVFVKSVAFGNTGLRSSNFGAPPSCVPGCYDANQTDGSLNSNDTLNTSAAIVKNFTYLGTPNSAVAGFQPGQVAYLIEAAATTGPWNGGSVSYAFSLY
ncbi:MAG TPA: TadE family protein [Bryobacteraceae bacterium]|nr:TadE family protein [Bryobacteraceae bacterium]